MHCVETAEFASLLAYHLPALMEHREAFPASDLTQYWIESRSRLEQWHRTLAEYHTIDVDMRPFAMQAWWTDQQAVMEEIIVTDILTRMVAAVGLAIDQKWKQREIEPVTHSVFVSHLEARNRVFQLVLFGRGSSAAQSLQLNRLRRAVERWIDRLLAPIATIEPSVRRYAVDTTRLDANLEDYREEASPAMRCLSNTLSRSAMRCTLKSRTHQRSANPDYNDKIVETAIALLPAKAFDSLGWLKSTKFGQFVQFHHPDAQLTRNQFFHSLIANETPRHPLLPKTARWLM